ncbi:hypothetical protein NFHkm12_06950 [Latilactobacillus curvatus]|nr:hypothetical protein NFHkm12_06950 [Latilactobacillus curvatus]
MVDETARNNFETATDGVQAYHNYFGTPTHDDRIWFELLTSWGLPSGVELESSCK